MKTIAITGSSGSGKSRISNHLREQGFIVIDVDKLAKQLHPLVINEIKETFGEQYIEDGKINTKNLALLVFNSRIELDKLNEIMFPVIKNKIEEIIEEYKRKDTELLFFDIAALFSSGFEKYFDHIVLLLASRETRLERLIKSRKIDANIARIQVDSVHITVNEILKCSLSISNEKNENDSKVFEKLTSWINTLKGGNNLNDGENRTN